MPTHLAESPLTCVAVGSGRSLEEFEAMTKSAKARARGRRNGGRSRYS
jgi:rod shape-determining protein MreB